MTTVGIYVDGPNMERGLSDSGDMAILERLGSLLMAYSSTLGEVVEGKVFVDEDTLWRSEQTRDDYLRNGFALVESKSFKHLDPHTHSYVFGKSLTDPSMHCAMVDRLHDPDCPDIFVVVTGDKDVTIALEYVHAHGKAAMVLGEADSLSSFLVSKCDTLGFGCHIIQLVARTMKRSTTRPSAPPRGAEQELKVTDSSGRPDSAHTYVQYRNNRSNANNPNNIAYWRTRGFHERPPDWEERVAKEKDRRPEARDGSEVT